MDSQSPKSPCDGVSHAAGTIALLGTIVHPGVLDDVPPVPQTGTIPHAAGLPVWASMTTENIAGESGG